MNSEWKSLLSLLALVALSSSSVVSQTTQDALYFRNGSIIRGVIVEMIPDSTVKIRTADGSVFVYAYAEVERFTREEVTPAQSDGDEPGSHFAVLGGVAIPSGDFSSILGETAGYAQTGYAFGVEYTGYGAGSVVWSVSVLAAFNGMDKEPLEQVLEGTGASIDVTSYRTIATMAGVGLRSKDPRVRFHLQGLAGAMFGSTPELKVSSPFGTVNQPTASATSFAYGGQVGMVLNGKLMVLARVITGRPKYKVTVSGLGLSETSEFEQPTAIIQILGGVVF